MTITIIKILAVLNLLESAVKEKVAALQAEYPDTEEAASKFLSWFQEHVGDKLTPEAALALGEQAWAELTGPTPGYNPHHGGGV